MYKNTSINEQLNDPVNFDLLLINSDGDLSIALSICRLFLHNYKKDTIELQTSLLGKQSNKAFSDAHSFKFILGFLGARQALEHIYFLEREIKKRDWEAAESRFLLFKQTMDILGVYVQHIINKQQYLIQGCQSPANDQSAPC